MAEKTTTPATPKVIRTGTYEGMFLFGAGAAQDVNGAQNTVRGMIEKHGGQILVLKRWDERKLAFELKKQKRGVYIIAYFKAPTGAITAIDREVRLSEDVLRVLITEADHMNQAEMEAVEPQPIAPREERNPWDRPSDDRGPRRDFSGPRRDDRGPRNDGPRSDAPRGDDRGPRRDENAPEAAGAGKD